MTTTRILTIVIEPFVNSLSGVSLHKKFLSRIIPQTIIFQILLRLKRVLRIL